MLEVPKPPVKGVPPVDGGVQDQGLSGTRMGLGFTKHRRFLRLAILFAVVAAAGVSAWALFLRPINVQVLQLEPNVPVQVFGLGTVEARVTSKVGLKVSGVLVDLSADVGDRVAKGAVLARLDEREQRARVARAERRSRTSAGQFGKSNGERRKGQGQLRQCQEHQRASAKTGSKQ